MIKKLLLVCLICLTVSCTHEPFNWEAKPWKNSHTIQGIINKDGEVILCEQPEFSDYFSFHYDNIAELKAEIDRHNDLTPTQKSYLKSMVDEMLNVPESFDF